MGTRREEKDRQRRWKRSGGLDRGTCQGEGMVFVSIEP